MTVAQEQGWRVQPRYVRVGGIRTHCVVAGQGPPVVLLSGLASSVAASWQRVLPVLAQRYRVHAVDLPGQGDSDKPPRDYTFEAGMDALEELLETLRLGAAHLVGASAGGLLALGLALRAPRRVDRLVLIGSAGFGRQLALGLRLATLPLVGELLAMPHRSVVAWSLRQNFVNPRLASPELVEELTRVRRQPGAKQALLSALRNSVTLGGLRPHLVLQDQLHALSAPTLILWGAQDRVLPVAHGYIGQRLIPNARLHVLEGAGHDAAVERPQEVARLVTEFLG